VSSRLAIVLPGQGSQRLGMLDALPYSDGMVRLLDAAEALSGLDLREVATSGTPDQLADTRAAQPLLYLADWVWGSEAIAAGLTPAFLAGHSLGELAALALAGVYSPEAGLELVVERSRLMASAAAETPGGMAAVLGMDSADIAAVVDDISGVWIANDNAPGQVVISGTHEALERATQALSEAGARRVVPLAVAGPFHSPLMAPAADAFAALLDLAAFTDARIPVLSNAEPEPATDAGLLRDRLKSQITSPVRWTETMTRMRAAGVDTLIEAGPGAVLKGLARRVEGLTAYAVEDAGVDPIVEEVS